MALKKTVTTVHGIEVIDAYHRVEGIQLIGKDQITFNARSYKDPMFPFFEEKVAVCDYDMNGANPLAQAYAHLKTLPEFADAVDC